MNTYKAYRRMPDGTIFDCHLIMSDTLESAWDKALDLWGLEHPEATRRVDRTR